MGSLSARRAWIEISVRSALHCCDRVALRKESVDRNIARETTGIKPILSLSARRAWIEIKYVVKDSDFAGVALRKESVDRNIPRGQLPTPEPVALRKESVDRNFEGVLVLRKITIVALRKESVDRNDIRNTASTRPSSRSPQGERG